MPPLREGKQTMQCQNNVSLAVEMSNYYWQASGILLPLSHWTQSITQKVQIHCLKKKWGHTFYKEVKFGIKSEYVVFGPFSPQMTQRPSAHDKDNGIGTISTMTKQGNAFTNEVPWYRHFTEPINNLSWGQVASDVDLMLCHDTSVQNTAVYTTWVHAIACLYTTSIQTEKFGLFIHIIWLHSLGSICLKFVHANHLKSQ